MIGYTTDSPQWILSVHFPRQRCTIHSLWQQLIDCLTLGSRPYGPDAPRTYLDRPFLHHNLTSTPWSPVPLLKFQMAPRLKILMTSRSKKGDQIYFSSLSKVMAKEPPPGFPNSAFSTYPSGSPAREPSLQVPFTNENFYLKGTCKWWNNIFFGV